MRLTAGNADRVARMVGGYAHPGYGCWVVAWNTSLDYDDPEGETVVAREGDVIYRNDDERWLIQGWNQG